MRVNVIGSIVPETDHCHASSTVELMWRVPYATRPSRMIAAPFIKTIEALARISSSIPVKNRTPVAHTLSLLLTSVEHGRHDHEPGRDCALADTKECATCEEPAKVCCRGMAEQGDRPNEDVQTGNIEELSGVAVARMDRCAACVST